MKVKHALLTFCIAINFLINAQTGSEFGTEISNIMQHMKSYTMAVARQMPENLYDFKPSKEDTVRSFSEVMKHLVVSIEFQTTTVLERKDFDPLKTLKLFEEFENTSMTKAEIISKMETAFDKLIDKLSSMTDSDFNLKYKLPFSGSEPKSMRVLAMFIRDHITHHRGQATTYLRINNIEPSFYQPF